MSGTSMPQRTRSRTAAKRFALIGTLAMLVAGIAGCASPQVSHETSARSVEAMVPAFERAQSVDDEITNMNLVEAAGIEPSSVRLIAVDNDTPFWVARGTNEDVCVLYAMQGSELTGFSCGSSSTLEAHGLAVASFANTTDQYTEAYLVPADVSDAVAEATIGLNNPAPGLFTRYSPNENPAVEGIEIPRGDSGKPAFVFGELYTK